LLVNHRQLQTIPRFLDRVGPGRFVLDHAAKPAIAARGWQSLPWRAIPTSGARFPDL
jgi:L-fuconolactonase